MPWSLRSCKRRGRTPATSLVEFALVSPWFVLLTIGFLQVALWGLGVLLIQLAAHEAAETAAGTYLAQYRTQGSWEQVTGSDDNSWRIAAIAGFNRGMDVLKLVPITERDKLKLVTVRLVEEQLNRGQEGQRRIEATAIASLPRLAGLPVPFILSPYRAKYTVRPTRFYSY